LALIAGVLLLLLNLISALPFMLPASFVSPSLGIGSLAKSISFRVIVD